MSAAPGRTILSPEQGTNLLAPLGDVEVLEVTRAATTNDVFRVVTRRHGNYYVKFHTARWYADQPDTFFVVERECAVHELLAKRGMGLPYVAWADCTREVVDRSVYICGELDGVPVPQAIRECPREMPRIVAALGRYLRRLHGIEFSRPGILSGVHAHVARSTGRVPPVFSWDQHSMHSAEILQREALRDLEDCRRQALLPESAACALEGLFEQAAEIAGPHYDPPRFTVGNCHVWHFHVARGNRNWEVLGFYDFEAVSAGNASVDHAELEAGLAPAVGSFAWREPYYEGYGCRPDLCGHKIHMLRYLLSELRGHRSALVPDAEWLRSRWLELINARDWEEFAWYPPAPPAARSPS